MFGELRRRPLITMGVQTYRVIRLALAVMAAVCLALGIFALTASWLPEPETRAGIGAWFLLLGSACLLFVWRGRWRPAETLEEKTRDEMISRRMEPFVMGAELLFLSLALLGLLAPARVGSLWREYRSSLTRFGLALVVDLGLRVYRRRARPTQPSAERSDTSTSSVE